MIYLEELAEKIEAAKRRAHDRFDGPEGDYVGLKELEALEIGMIFSKRTKP